MDTEQIGTLIIRLMNDVKNQAFYEFNDVCDKSVWRIYAERIEETKVRLSEDHGINIP